MQKDNNNKKDTLDQFKIVQKQQSIHITHIHFHFMYPNNIPIQPQLSTIKHRLNMITTSIYILTIVLLLLSTQISTIHAFKSQKKAITTYIKNHYDAAVSAQSKCILNKNSSTIAGGEVLLSVMEPFPTAALAVNICCDIANGNFWTNVDYGPSKKYKDRLITTY